VILTLILLEWGSVQINEASTNFTLLRPLTNFKHKANSSGDSSSQWTQGGFRYLLQSLQWNSTVFLVIPSVISSWDFKQLMHVFDAFGVIITPHMQQRLKVKLINWNENIHLLSL
jgi:hypothetical protein